MAGLAVLLAVGWSLSLVTPLPGEADAADTVASWRSVVPTAVARWVTYVGDLWVVGLATVVAWLVAGRARRPGRVRVMLLTTVLGSQLLIGVLKLVTARARPEEALLGTISSAYPSGHSARAAAFYGLAAWGCYRWLSNGAARWVGVAAMSLLAVAIALSRLLLGVHRLSEVVIGFLLGLAWLGMVTAAVGPKDDRHGRTG